MMVAVTAALRIGAIVPVTLAEGPGARFALWVAGCSIRCAGCCNPHLFDPAVGREVSAGALVAAIARVRTEIEGVTFLGGEPFEQAAGLAAVAAGARGLGLSVAVFTGHAREALEAAPGTGVRALLSEIDLLVDGPFDASRPERARRWVGSENQRFHYLTDRYDASIEQPLAEARHVVEVRIAPDGRVVQSGWPEVAPGRLRRRDRRG